MRSKNSQEGNSFGNNEEVTSESLSPRELEELERLAIENGPIGKIAQAWIEVEESE